MKTRDVRAMTITLEDDGVVHGKVKQDAQLGIADAQEVIEALFELTGGQKHCILTDVRGIRSISREARQYTMRPGNKRGTVAQAFLVESSVSRVVANFALGLNRPPFPVKMFNNEEQARAWLLARMDEHRE